MKPPATMLIEAVLMPCVRDIVAEAGDHLVVVNGVCIGVDTARHTKRQHAEPQQLEHSKPPADGRKQPPRPKLDRAAKAALHKRLNRDTVLRALGTLCGAANQPVGIQTILDSMKLKGERERAMGGFYLRKLLDEGKVAKDVPDPSAPLNTRYLYSLVREPKIKAA